MPLRPPISRLFPYTTLFRSRFLVEKPLLELAHEPLALLRVDRPTLPGVQRSEEHTSELQSLTNLVCRLLLEKKKDFAISNSRFASGDTSIKLAMHTSSAHR